MNLKIYWITAVVFMTRCACLRIVVNTTTFKLSDKKRKCNHQDLRLSVILKVLQRATVLMFLADVHFRFCSI